MIRLYESVAFRGAVHINNTVETSARLGADKFKGRLRMSRSDEDPGTLIVQIGSYERDGTFTAVETVDVPWTNVTYATRLPPPAPPEAKKKATPAEVRAAAEAARAGAE